jgi:hypothetical protein
MNCLKCEQKMEKGALAGEGAYWNDQGFLESLQPKNWFGAQKVTAWKCTNCGYIELQVEK